jgi:hypothetical protein
MRSVSGITNTERVKQRIREGTAQINIKEWLGHFI